MVFPNSIGVWFMFRTKTAIKWGVFNFSDTPKLHVFPVARVWCTFPCIKWVDGISMADRLRFVLRKYLSIIYKKMVCGHDLHRYPWEACSLDRSQHEHVCVDEPEVVKFVILLFESLSLSLLDCGRVGARRKNPDRFLNPPLWILCQSETTCSCLFILSWM